MRHPFADTVAARQSQRVAPALAALALLAGCDAMLAPPGPPSEISRLTGRTLLVRSSAGLSFSATWNGRKIEAPLDPGPVFDTWVPVGLPVLEEAQRGALAVRVMLASPHTGAALAPRCGPDRRSFRFVLALRDQRQMSVTASTGSPDCVALAAG